VTPNDLSLIRAWARPRCTLPLLTSRPRAAADGAKTSAVERSVTAHFNRGMAQQTITPRTCFVSFAICTLIVVMGGGLIMPAIAKSDTPPKARLRYRGEGIQRAHIAASCWPGEDGGYGCGETTPMTWPRRDRVKSTATLRMRIGSRSKPKRIHIDSYRSIRKNGRPRGRGRDIRARREAVRRDGRIVAWDVVFRLHATRVHYVRAIVDVPHTVALNLKVRIVE
jgi:hypothetical protein